MTLVPDSRKHVRDSQQEAIEWLLRLQEPHVPPNVLLEWERWLQAQPDNKRAFDAAGRLAKTVEHFRGDLESIPLSDERALAQDTYDGSTPVSAWQDRRKTSAGGVSSGRRNAAWFSMAAALAAVIAGLGTIHSGLFDRISSAGLSNYRTAESEHRDIDLPDGSTIVLGAESALVVSFSSDRRTVVLETGEALFDVAKDPDRPFVVLAGSGTITAVGTAFNVSRSADRVVVTVTEGRVEVAQTAPVQGSEPSSAPPTSMTADPPDRATLAVGERAVYDSHGLNRVDKVEPVTATVWREGRLRYRSEPLKYVIPDVDRYSSKEIIIGDDRIGELTFTGTVFQSNVYEWVAGLERVFPIDVVEIGGNKVLLRSRRSAATAE